MSGLRENWIKYPTDEQRLEARRQQRRESMRRARTHCQRDHEFTPENTIVRADGQRRCRECQRQADARKGQTYEMKAKYVDVRCPECGDTRTITDRNARKIRQGESSGKCRECANGSRKPPVERLPREDYVQWWRAQGFTPEDAQEIWAGLSLLVPSTYDDDALRRAA